LFLAPWDGCRGCHGCRRGRGCCGCRHGHGCRRGCRHGHGCRGCRCCHRLVVIVIVVMYFRTVFVILQKDDISDFHLNVNSFVFHAVVIVT